MLESLRVKFVDWVQTRLNPCVNRRHPIHILMTNNGLKPIARRKRHIYSVTLDGGRLIGVYEVFLPGEIFKTCMRVCIYEKKTVSEKRFGDVTYCAANIFFHTDGEDQFRLGSMYRTSFLTFAELAEATRNAKASTRDLGQVFRIQLDSKAKGESPIKAT